MTQGRSWWVLGALFPPRPFPGVFRNSLTFPDLVLGSFLGISSPQLTSEPFLGGFRSSHTSRTTFPMVLRNISPQPPLLGHVWVVFRNSPASQSSFWWFLGTLSPPRAHSEGSQERLTTPDLPRPLFGPFLATLPPPRPFLGAFRSFPPQPTSEAALIPAALGNPPTPQTSSQPFQALPTVSRNSSHFQDTTPNAFSGTSPGPEPPSEAVPAGFSASPKSSPRGHGPDPARPGGPRAPRGVPEGLSPRKKGDLGAPLWGAGCRRGAAGDSPSACAAGAARPGRARSSRG